MKKKIIIFGLLILGIYLLLKNIPWEYINTSTYEVIKQDTNPNYLGIGQEVVNGRDGYFNTFTTTEKYQKTYIEYKQNGNSSWSNNSYWGGAMAENGCGITALATILSGYGRNDTPETLRQKYYPVLNYDTLPQELSDTFQIKNSDFCYNSIYFSKENLQQHLQTNRPILVCVWNKPHNNRWTTASHYLVLLATDGNDLVYVSNPNRRKK